MKIVIECREDSELEIVIRCNKVDDNIKKIISLLEDNKFIIGKLNNRSYQIMVNDIYYIEANEDRVFLYCKDKVYETNSRLYELENELETCSFIRISKSILLNLNKLDNVEFYVGKAEEVVPKMYKQGKRANVVVVDPPRKGCDEKVLDTIVSMEPDRVVYVSCNPSTLARDLNYLDERGYKCLEVQPVDMFPHSVHIENVALIVKK